MSNNNGEGHHQPVPQVPQKKNMNVSSEEAIGNAWATRVVLVAMASHLDCLDEMEEKVKHHLGSVQEKGLISKNKELIKENLPKFFRGIESAHNNFLQLIEWEKRGKNKHEPDADTERNKFLADVFVAVIEGGIDYWAQIRNYHYQNDDEGNLVDAEAEVKGNEGGPPDDWVRIDLKTVSKGLEILRQGKVKINRTLLGNTLVADVTNDAGEIDSKLADCIIQVALFDDIVYV